MLTFKKFKEHVNNSHIMWDDHIVLYKGKPLDVEAISVGNPRDYTLGYETVGERKWKKAKLALLKALEKYPRPLDTEALNTAILNQFWMDPFNIFEDDIPNLSEFKLRLYSDKLHLVVDALNRDYPWIQKIPTHISLITPIEENTDDTQSE